jgi:hypothetical protein
MPPVVQRRKPYTRRRRDGLLRHARNEKSQTGEDGILAFIFSTILPPHTSPRWVVEVGAWDGQHYSNSWNLLCRGAEEGCGRWAGVLLEADANKSEEAAKYYEAANLHQPVIVESVLVGLSNERKLDVILSGCAPELPCEFELLSIDIDGWDYFVWEDIEKYAPLCVCIEYNPTIPTHIVYIQERSENVRQGCSIRALVELAEGKGYRLVESTLYNAIFIREHLWDKFSNFLPPNMCGDIDELCELTMGTDLWQLYDGTLAIAGCKKLLWHRVPISHEGIQVLPPESRGYFPFAPPVDKMST